MPTRPYTFVELTNTICSICLQKLEAKIIFQNDNVYILKNCPEHGKQKVLVSTDIPYYLKTREFLKPGDMPYGFATPIKYGCPYDCGLCPDHEQHSCVSLVEVTDRCNLQCPTCYAESGPSAGRHRTLDEIITMLDVIVASEKNPDVVQISGGEPTLHPDFWAILDEAKKRPIRHLMLNTNGVRLAQDKEFVKRLATYQPDFEVYLQFDSLEEIPLQKLRGVDLRTVRQKALQNLNEYSVSTTLVVTLQKGLNTPEIGRIIDFALTQKCVRGVTFQPTQVAGRLENFNPETDRLTLSEVRQEILKQAPLFQSDDIVPVPCHPEAIAMGYALKLGGQVFPLTRYFSPEMLLSSVGNTITLENLPGVRDQLLNLFSTGRSTDASVHTLQSIMCCLPDIECPELSYDNLFRIIIMQFYDPYNFDVRGVKRSCVHIVHKDGRLIPFDTMNIFYRDPDVEARIKKGRGPAYV